MRIAFSNLNDTMPISCESIGYHWRQYPIYRPNGYRFFHWLQTESSSGTVKIDGQQIHLLPNSGILIRHTVPHSYSADSDAKEWDTAYITFYGPLANYLVNYLDVEDYRVFEDLPENITNFIQSNYRAFINNTIADQANQSVLIYRYLLLLHQMDIVHGQQSKSDPIRSLTVSPAFWKVIINLTLPIKASVTSPACRFLTRRIFSGKNTA
ncbi:AraC family ligand binding domain-containing protein [Lentilactobacillus buchneri]|uniref:AraC family ligand binding domain-containing protein n=1 Tax=Lentilactobacillus buchneri TaxID=1581 RepID=UPI0002075E07|nr:AraC family ligand binding domain-containing protein [Lentilactobacillus buchneri]AEB74185.1 AraC protein arabinose-binding/dimerization [Lentilactobacillus buchneri NRRL B-30929]